MTDITAVWVWPSEEGQPPRASLINIPSGEQVTVTWSRDQGTWLFPNGMQTDDDLAELITDHAKSLGVEW